MRANNRIRYRQKVVTLSHYYHYTNLSEGIKQLTCLWCIRGRVWRWYSFVWYYTLIIIIMQTYLKGTMTCLLGISCRARVKDQVSSFNYGLCNIWGSVFSFPFSCDIISIKSEVWIISHCLALVHERIVCVLFYANARDNWQLAMLPQSEHHEFNSHMVHHRMSVRLWVLCDSLCQSTKNQRNKYVYWQS